MISFRERCDLIKSKVSLKMLFDEVGMHYQKTERPHQIRCPMHGTDVNASARFFPKQNNGSGSFWCWACDDGGDVIHFTEIWFGLDNPIKAAEHLEKMFGLERTEDDILKQFSKDYQSVRNSQSDTGIVEAHALVVEVNLAGRVYDSDPVTIDERYLPAGPRTDRELEIIVEAWSEYDRIVAEPNSYSSIVKKLDSWHKTLLSRIQEEQGAKD